MAYRRSGRPTYYFEARTETGRKQLSTGTPNRALAGRIEGMWDALAVSHRAWDILNSVLAGRLTVGRVFDAWSRAGHDATQLRRLLADVDLVPLVEEWVEIHRRRVKPDSAAHALAHVRYFFPEGQRVLASQVTPDWLTGSLFAYPGKRNILRKVHSSASMFLAYCADVKSLFAVNPMLKVERPTAERSPSRYYDLPTVERIVAGQPCEARRALFALLYGTGIEVSVALRLARSDFDPAERSVRAAGTKAHIRDRICRVADWAWEMVWQHVRNVLPTAPIFPATWDRWTVSDWHRQTIGDGVKSTHGEVIRAGLTLRDRYPLHNARDHWAVRQLRAGVPVAVVQAQLGHASPMLTLTKYGRFIPSAADRNRWEQTVSAFDARREAAK